MDNLKKHLLLLAFSLLSFVFTAQAQRYGLVIHGGAGTIRPDGMSEERQKEYEDALNKSLNAGFDVLEKGGTAEEAVLATIQLMEDNALFNCGKGSVLNTEGIVEMDASIMLGHTLDAGAVAGVKTVRHPILAASKVMHNSPHVLMSNDGADQFAKEQGLEIQKPSFFITPTSKERLRSAKERLKEQGMLDGEYSDWKYGTVGCVALDKNGNLAAGTSTGGMTNKMFNRIGDSPIIGAGTYANNASCAVSCTGHGEYFIRLGVAREVSALMMYKGYDVDKAARFVIHDQLEKLGGQGGLIALDRRGNLSMPFNTSGMFRGYRFSDQSSAVKMFKD